MIICNFVSRFYFFFILCKSERKRKKVRERDRERERESERERNKNQKVHKERRITKRTKIIRVRAILKILFDLPGEI